MTPLARTRAIPARTRVTPPAPHARARRVAVAIAATLLSAGAAGAQTNTGTTVGQFLLIEPSARLAAMGNVGVGAFEGVQGTYYNPAAIGLLDRWELAFTHAIWFEGIDYEHAAVGIPMGRLGRAVATLTSLRSGDIDVRTVEQPLGTGELFSVNDVALGLGYGLQITDRVSAGIQANYVQETIWHSSTSTVTFSMGTLYQVAGNGLRLGASLSNFGVRARFTGRDLRILYDQDPNRFGDNNTLPGERYTQSYPVPQVFRVGLGVPLDLGAGQRLYVEADAFHPSDNTESMSVGTEYSFRGKFALRAGYQNLFLQDAEGGLSAGAGYANNSDPLRYRIDYAWGGHGRLGDTHRIGLGINF